MKKIKINKTPKGFLLLSGKALLGFVLFSILHNFFYALAITFQHIKLLNVLFGALDVFFFLVAIFIFPLLFLVGIIGALVIHSQRWRYRVQKKDPRTPPNGNTKRT
jgi:hypothetical protein